MTKEEVDEFIGTNVGFETVTLLRNYLEFGAISRRFMLNEHKSILDSALERKDMFTSYTDQQISHVVSNIFLEALERTFLLIEDFCAICRGLWGQLNLFPQSFKKSCKPREVLAQFQDDKWKTILRYIPTEQLPLNVNEHKFLEGMRLKNISHLSNFVQTLAGFTDYYWQTFIKFKHANTLIYGVGMKQLDGDHSILIPVVDKEHKFEDWNHVVISLSMYHEFLRIVDTLVQLNKDIIELTLRFIETGGKPFMLGVRFIKITEGEETILNKLQKKYEGMIIRYPVEITLKITVKKPALDRFRTLLSRLNPQKHTFP